MTTATVIRLDREDTLLAEFDYRFIYDAIRWAERDESFLSALSEADRNWWGTWRQGDWARAIAPAPIRRALFDATGSLDTGEFATAIRAGECKTAYCMAGQRVNQAGYRMAIEPDSDMGRSGVTAYSCIEMEPTGQRDKFNKPIMRDKPGAELRDISTLARELMHITSFESGLFFNGDNRVGILKEYANGMCERRGIPLMFPDFDIYDFDQAFADSEDN